MISLPGDCKAVVADYEAQPRITGKLLNDSRELELTFDYGNVALKAVATCPNVGSREVSRTLDLSPIAPKTVKYPEDGGSKLFPINSSIGRGNITIIVNKDVTNIAR